MLCSHQSNQGFNYWNNNKIKKHLPERCLQRIHNGKLLSYEKLIKKFGSAYVHHRNIQSIAIETFQIKHGWSFVAVTDIFTQTKRQHNFRKVEILGYHR